MELSSNLTLASVVSVQIQSCVTKFEDETNRRKKYTAFIIELRTHGGLVWTVERRFSQFYKLNQVRRTASLRLREHRDPVAAPSSSPRLALFLSSPLCRS